MIYSASLRDETLKSDAFRRVLETTQSMQLATMTLLPGETTGFEVHMTTEQFFYVEAGSAFVRTRARLADAETSETHLSVHAGGAFIVPRNTAHWVSCASEAKEPLRLFTLYSEQRHEANVVHARQAQADAETEFVKR